MPQINPYKKFDRYRYAWDLIPLNTEYLIDYGGFDGEFASTLTRKAKNIFCLDVNRDALVDGQKKFPEIRFFRIKIDSRKTELEDSFFDVATILDVIEHVPDDKNTIIELKRVLKKDGLLILSAPHKGLFTICDPGNIKFYFPRLHKYIYLYLLKKRDYYYKRFIDSPDGLVGDISRSENMYHKHYTINDLKKLLEPQFTIVYYKRFGLFHRLIGIINYIFKLFAKRDSNILERLDSIDLSVDFGAIADNIIIVAKNNKI